MFAFEKQKRKDAERTYNRAMELFNNAQIKQARELFYEAGDYLDSEKRYQELSEYANKTVLTSVIIIGVIFVTIVSVLIIF